MKRRIKVLAVIMAAVLMVSGAGSTLYENGVKADAKDTLKWNSEITKVKVKKRVALTVNVEASKVQWSVAGKNAATADLASANAYASVDHNGVASYSMSYFYSIFNYIIVKPFRVYFFWKCYISRLSVKYTNGK